MRFPKLKSISAKVQTENAFGGYRHGVRVPFGEWREMTNMSATHYPALSVRTPRGVYATPTAARGLARYDTLLYVDGADLVVNGVHIDLSLADDGKEKTLVRMGAYVIVLPDKRYVNLADLSDYGAIEAHVTASEVEIAPCRADGTYYDRVVVSPAEPAIPAKGESLAWLDTSRAPHALLEYSAILSGFVELEKTYLRVCATNIGSPFSAGDGVRFSGISEDADGYYTLVLCERDALVVAAPPMAATTLSTLTLSREMPEMDFVTEAGNRLWGCRYGVAKNGEVVNEIYASALGDFRNWHVFDGLASDAYVCGVGSDGAFTGAATYLGTPVFFKERFLHRVLGSYPATYGVASTPIQGVKKGSEKSIALLGDALLYHGDAGVYLYDGSLPRLVSDALGTRRFECAAAGTLGEKYYVSMRDSADGAWNMFVYDASRDLWHREDDTKATCFCEVRGELYFIDGAGRIMTVGGSGTPETGNVPFLLESGVIGLDDPARRYLSRIHVRMALGACSRVTISAQYDSTGEFYELFSTRSRTFRGYTAILRPRRADHLRLRIEGEGDVKIFAMTLFEEGGNAFDA